MRNSMLVLVAMTVFALTAISADKKNADPVTEMRVAMADAESVLVVVADSQPRPYVPRPGHLAVFPVSGITNVDGNRVTVKAGTFVIADMNEVEQPKKVAGELLAKWKSRKGENLMVVRESGKTMAYTFFFGELKEDRTFEVNKVIVAGKP